MWCSLPASFRVESLSEVSLSWMHLLLAQGGSACGRVSAAATMFKFFQKRQAASNPARKEAPQNENRPSRSRGEKKPVSRLTPLTQSQLAKVIADSKGPWQAFSRPLPLSEVCRAVQRAYPDGI